MRLIYLLILIALIGCKTQEKTLVSVAISKTIPEIITEDTCNIEIIETKNIDLGGKFEIRGTVYDAAGEPLPFILLELKDTALLKRTAQTDLSGEFRIKINSSGVYSFRVIAMGYKKCIINTWSIKPNKIYNLKIVLKEHQVQMLKPVVYLYPVKETEVEVKVVPNGDFLFTYPEYNYGWNVTASPNGKLKDSTNEYDYLFWDADVKWSPNQSYLENGSYVKKNELIPFFERKLEEIGLNSSEINDFITFWGPKLCKNELSYIHFVVNEDCNEISSLKISPKPDNTLRLFMIYHDASDLNKQKIVKEQYFKSFNRTGFTAVEWGGGEYNYYVLKSTISKIQSH